MSPTATTRTAALDTDEELAASALAGDQASLHALLERYRPLVRSKARSYFLAGADREDVVQEGMIGLYKSVRDFDASRKVSFRAFADLCVTRQIISAVKSATRQKHGPLNSYVSLHSQGTGGSHELTLVERVAVHEPDVADHVVSAVELAALEVHVGDTLSELEADVLQRYVDGESYADIAAALDRHVKSIDNALQRIKRKVEMFLHQRDPERRAVAT